MADQGADLPYAEMVRRQGAEDIARLRAAEVGRLLVVGRVLNQGDDGSLVLELLRIDGDKHVASLACLSRDQQAQRR